jgi:iron complex transport system substrate-binding protein
VSLTASLTETLFAIGVGNRIVGVTDTCDFPDEAREKPNVSCWFAPDLERLFALAPDLVLGLETAHTAIRSTLESEGISVILVNPATVEEALEVIAMLGVRLQAAERAQTCIWNLRSRLAQLDTKVARIPFSERHTVSRVLDIENDRFIVAGPLSFQYDVISRAGGRNVTGQIRETYPKVSFRQFRRWDPQMVFFCGYDRHFIPRFCADKKWRSLRAVQSGRVYQFDCALTCRTGPRILDMAELLFQTLYPDWA